MTAHPITLADLGEFVVRVMEDPNLPPRLREYMIAVVHEMRMQKVQGRSRLRTQVDIGRRGSDIWRDAAWLLYPDLDEAGAWRMARAVIGDDAPRYEMTFPKMDEKFCVGKMLRPAGAPCQRRPSLQASVPHPFTGERHMIGACRDPRHQEAYNAQHRDAWAAWRANGSPQPANNTGGHLRRYFTYRNWDELYAWANRRYTPGETPKPVPERARLALVTPLRPKDS